MNTQLRLSFVTAHNFCSVSLRFDKFAQHIHNVTVQHDTNTMHVFLDFTLQLSHDNKLHKTQNAASKCKSIAEPDCSKAPQDNLYSTISMDATSAFNAAPFISVIDCCRRESY